MRFASIVLSSYVDGPGRRAALFMQGCSIRCEGCQNVHLWPASSGFQFPLTDVAQVLVETGLPITITGGEPFDQAADLYTLLHHICHLDPHRRVILYSGYTFEELVATGRFEVLAALAMADVLVDGPYLRKQDAPGMQYRGSRNQRVIDLQATLKRPASQVLTQGPVLLDWDTPELILTDDGDLLGATPVVAEFSEVGVTTATRRCGESA
jgi:anaerobic ribonucleoside-triphosphate reductase activating protein